MPPSVLIADNDRAVSALLVEVVRRLGCDVGAVYDGEAAIAALDAGSFRVLVCDLDMPKASGFDVVKWAAARREAPCTLVISGFVDAAIERQLRAFACVRAVLKKPFDLLRFAGQVRDLLLAGATPGEDGG